MLSVNWELADLLPTL